MSSRTVAQAAEHARRIMQTRHEREAAERRAHPSVPYLDGKPDEAPRFARYQTARGRRIVARG